MDKLATCRCDCVSPYTFRLKPDATRIIDVHQFYLSVSSLEGLKFLLKTSISPPSWNFITIRACALHLVESGKELAATMYVSFIRKVWPSRVGLLQSESKQNDWYLIMCDSCSMYSTEIMTYSRGTATLWIKAKWLIYLSTTHAQFISTCTIGNDASPLCGEGVLIELVQVLNATVTVSCCYVFCWLRLPIITV